MFENIEANRSNFCIGPQSGTFCTVDNEADPVVMHVKNDLGVIQRTYTFYPSDTLHVGATELVDMPLLGELYEGDYQSHEFVTIQYVGPYDQTSYYSGAIFYTLERRALGKRKYYSYTYNGATSYRAEYSSNIIRKWVLDNTNFRLELAQTFTLNSDEDNWFGSTAFAIDNIVTTFDDHTAAGTGVIEVTTTSGLKKYDTLMLGPSSDTSNPGEVEEVYVHSITGTTVEIRTYGGTTPPQWEYVQGDPITLHKSIYLFGDPAPTLDDEYIANGPASTSGTLYKLDQTNYGAILDTDYRAFYADVPCATWNNYFGFLSFIKGSNLLHLNTLDYEITRSQDAHLESPVSQAALQIYDLDIKDASFYKLQMTILQRDDDGDYFEVDWDTYNYHTDTFIPYSNSVTLYVSKRVLLPQGQSFIYIIVRDQFGVGLLSKNVWVTAAGDIAGELTPLDGYLTTDANGRTSIQYDAGSEYAGHEEIKVVVDGGNTVHGSAYVVAKTVLQQLVDFTGESFLQTSFSLDTEVSVTAMPYRLHGISLAGHPAFTTPGGTLNDYSFNNWESTINSEKLTCPLVTRTTPIFSASDTVAGMLRVRQVILFELDPEYNYSSTIVRSEDEENVEKQISANYVSRHINYGSTDSTTLNQFVFIEDASPVMWSEKNNVDTDIWIRLRPFAASLNPDTLVFKIREVSYAGKTEWEDVTSQGAITMFDAGGGLLGIDFFYNPVGNFHHNALVYISIEVYDTAAIPNIITVDYWFKIIQDYKAPYVANHFPGIEAYDIPINTEINFDLIDEGEGVDITSLELFVNQRQMGFTYDEYEPGNYHVYCILYTAFHYGETVNISLQVKDRSDNENILLDGWRFYCAASTGPWFDMDNTTPALCLNGRNRKQTVAVQVYGIDDGGINYDSIKMEVGGKYRNIKITPIVYRLS